VTGVSTAEYQHFYIHTQLNKLTAAATPAMEIFGDGELEKDLSLGDAKDMTWKQLVNQL
jgi:hypothetical protein